jgi:hypothetical protein
MGRAGGAYGKADAGAGRDREQGIGNREQKEAAMIPVGYMAKRSCKKPEGFNGQGHDLPNVVDIYSVSSCVNDDFANYINYWKHNGYWLFDSPEIIRALAQENSIDLQGTMLFYYEAYEMQLTKEGWRPFSSESTIPTNVILPSRKKLEGFDVVTFYAGTLLSG